MSKIVIEEILHLFDRNIYLKQDWKQVRVYFLQLLQPPMLEEVQEA